MDEKNDKIAGTRCLWIALVLFFTNAIAFAEDRIDLYRLTRECAAASKHYRKISKAVAYKVLHTVEYTGWSGNPDCFNLQDPIVMTITFAGNDRRGAYWLKNKPETKVNIQAKTDFNGNIELIAVPPGGKGDYRFSGRMENGVIKGLWENKKDKKVFAFYAEVNENPLGKTDLPKQVK